MTELSFLIDLLLNHKLSKATRDAVATRIREVEGHFATSLPATSLPRPSLPSHLPPEIAKQSPSMQAIMLRNPDLVKGAESVNTVEFRGAPAREEPQPVAVIAQNAVTAAAMASRAEAIAAARAGKPDASGGKRKF